MDRTFANHYLWEAKSLETDVYPGHANSNGNRPRGILKYIVTTKTITHLHPAQKLQLSWPKYASVPRTAVGKVQTYEEYCLGNVKHHLSTAQLISSIDAE